MLPTSAISLVIAGCVALIAVATDLQSRRIPNWLTGGGLLLGFASNLVLTSLSDGVSGTISGALYAVMGAALGFGMLIPFHLIRVNGLGRAIGAGDVKLLAALGAIVGPHVVVSVMVYAALAGVVQSIVILAKQGHVRVMVHQTLVMGIAPSLSGRKAPYAVAIAAGVFLSLFLPPVVRF
jgi:prepilin peptidase CpaA